MKKLFLDYSLRTVSRQDFCHGLAAAQGFDNTVKSYLDNAGKLHASYRGRDAVVVDGLIKWCEDDRLYTASNLKIYKTKIDLHELHKQEAANE